MDVLKTGSKIVGGGKDGGLSVDTELVVGDKKEENEIQVGSKSETVQKAEQISNKVVNEVNPLMLLLLVLGWVLPSPGDMWRGLLGAIGGVWKETKGSIRGVWYGLVDLIKAIRGG